MKLDKQIELAIKKGSDYAEAQIPNVNAVTSGIVISREYFGEKVCTLPARLGKWMIDRNMTAVTVLEYGFKSNYILDNDRAKEIF